MASKIKVNTGSLDQTCKEIESRLNLMKKNMEQIEQDMNILNSMWTGEAHTTFTKAVSDDIQRFLTECDGVQEIVRYENNAVSEYNKCEQQIGELISQIRI